MVGAAARGDISKGNLSFVDFRCQRFCTFPLPHNDIAREGWLLAYLVKHVGHILSYRMLRLAQSYVTMWQLTVLLRISC